MTTPNHPEIPIERTREHWHRAGQYAANKEPIYPGHAEAQEFEAGRGKLVLEYGCGGGADAMSYLRRGAIVAYADVTHANVDAARDRIKEAGLDAMAAGIKLDESAKIPLEDGSVDIVSSHGVLHHIVDPVPVLREFHRVLKPEGRLYCMLYTELLERQFDRRIDALMKGRGLSREEAFGWCTDEEGTPYARSYTRDQGEAFLAAGGFKLLSTYDYGGGGIFRTFRAVRT